MLKFIRNFKMVAAQQQTKWGSERRACVTACVAHQGPRTQISLLFRKEQARHTGGWSRPAHDWDMELTEVFPRATILPHGQRLPREGMNVPGQGGGRWGPSVRVSASLSLQPGFCELWPKEAEGGSSSSWLGARSLEPAEKPRGLPSIRAMMGAYDSCFPGEQGEAGRLPKRKGGREHQVATWVWRPSCLWLSWKVCL